MGTAKMKGKVGICREKEQKSGRRKKKWRRNVKRSERERERG